MGSRTAFLRLEGQLFGHPGLADARLAAQEKHASPALLRTVQSRNQLPEFCVAADEQRPRGRSSLMATVLGPVKS